MRRICAVELVAVAQWENTRQHARGCNYRWHWHKS